MDSAQAEALKTNLLGKCIGGWIIDGAHGHGKSAVVMAAYRDGQRGAIKVFHPELVELFGKETQLERIRREISLVGSRHENLVEILDGGECEVTGHLFVVMEELPWKNLKEVLPRISHEQIKPLIQQLSSAAKYLEDKGLAHRDIKPENIAISSDLLKAKLLDLGVMRPFGISNLTDVKARPFIGTLRYSSPEFLRREEEDCVEGWRALTFYQIGAVLHDLLMKKEIFHDHSEPYAVLVEAVLTAIPEVHGGDVELVKLCNYSLVKSPMTRLELLGWTDFLGPQKSLASSNSLLNRIKSRQKYFREIGITIGLAGDEERRLLRQELEGTSTRLDTKVAVLLDSLKVFPLRATSQSIDSDDKTILYVVNFEKNAAIGLPNSISTIFTLHLMDENHGNSIYKLSICSHASISGREQELFKSIQIVGGIESLLSDSRIEEWLLLTLNSAYEITDKL